MNTKPVHPAALALARALDAYNAAPAWDNAAFATYRKAYAAWDAAGKPINAD